MTLLKVAEHEQLRKDPRSGAVINTDGKAHKANLKSKRERKRIDTIEEQVNKLNTKMDTIESLLRSLIQREEK